MPGAVERKATITAFNQCEFDANVRRQSWQGQGYYVQKNKPTRSLTVQEPDRQKKGMNV